jgi:endonuclease G
MTPEAFESALNAAIEAEDLDALLKLQSEFVDDGEPRLPFEPAVRLRTAPGEPELEADVGVAAANGLSRAIRDVRYRQKRRSGYSGPIIVSEGDSWFQYPIRLDDIIDNLSVRYAVRSLGAAGDTLANMLAHAEYREAIERERADFFLFSASGNDVLGGGALAEMLNPYAPGMEIPDVVRQDRLNAALARIEQGFETIINNALAVNPRLRILFHGYDKPIPRRDGRWLGRPMTERGIPAFLQADVAAYLIDHLNGLLAQFEGRYGDSVRHVDCRGRVGSTVQSWYDELHPRNPGYSRVADLFEHQIEALRQAPARVFTPAPAPRAAIDEAWTLLDSVLADAEGDLGGLAEEALIDAAATDAGAVGGPRGAHLSDLDRRILADYESLLQDRVEDDQDKRLRARRQMVPHNDEKGFERILGISNLFPINYLSRGAAKARAVAKIQLYYRGAIPAESGSGFLVAPGLLLTNNHVIATREEARTAKAVFDYQQNDDFEYESPKTFELSDSIFFTSERFALDFTFVAVRPVNARGEHLSDFGHFTLIEESGKAVKNEPVSIIQHPQGDHKALALRDSKILGVKGDFIYYSTDTEPGSSGSPVLNDQWLPVALHHRSVPHPQTPNKWIANRGIRISRIFAKLKDAAQQGDADARRILELLDAQAPPTPGVATMEPPALRPHEQDFLPTLSRVPAAAEAPLAEEAAFTADRWAGVDGYNPDFLELTVPLPLPSDEGVIRQVDGRPDLPYLHFSVIMHAQRKLPIVTACNVDGARLQRLPRRGSWRFDPRLPRSEQVGNDAYRHNAYDRGHLVRRLAPMWGTREDARFAEADTFHYTVAAPQHARLNQGIWLELEDYLVDWAERHQARLSIFTGALFRPDDPLYRGIVRVPADYWKVAVAESASGVRAVAYLHTQKNLIPSVEEAFGNYKTHRVPLHVVAELSGLDFAAVVPFDVAGGAFETRSGIRIVDGPEDIGL